MAQWKLTNPANNQSYTWPINPSEEEEIQRRQNIETSGNTSGLGLVVQQGSPDLLRKSGTGTIFTLAQKQALDGWFNLCYTQTVYLADDTGDVFEGIITEFSTTRQRVAINRRDMVNAPHHVWKYKFEFTIIRAVSGSMVGMVP